VSSCCQYCDGYKAQVTLDDVIADATVEPFGDAEESPSDAWEDDGGAVPSR
jgi:hypothetical protein